MKELQKLLSHTRAAVERYDMISDGEHIVVGVSGGKDSLALLCTLAELRRFYPKHFRLSALMVDMGFDKSEKVYAQPNTHENVAALCRRIDVPLHIKKTELASIIFDVRNESNPCSLCARMRRGIIHDEAILMGANKIALGHHRDDAVETTMLNLYFNGNFECFSPVTHMTRKDIYVIRPFILTEEREIRAFVKKAALPVEKSPCPEDGHTERANMKEYLRKFDIEHRGLYPRIIGALERGGISGWHE